MARVAELASDAARGIDALAVAAAVGEALVCSLSAERMSLTKDSLSTRQSAVGPRLFGRQVEVLLPLTA